MIVVFPQLNSTIPDIVEETKVDVAFPHLRFRHLIDKDTIETAQTAKYLLNIPQPTWDRTRSSPQRTSQEGAMQEREVETPREI